MSESIRKEWIRRCSWIPAIIIMVTIFNFSSKPADDSQKSSYFFSYRIVNVYENVTRQKLEANILEETLSKIDFYVRKTAHCMEYAALSFWIGVALLIRGFKRASVRLWSVIIAFCYAITDEVHQLFVPGRSGQIRDVIIDTSGAFLGTLILSLVLIIIGMYQNRKKVNKDTY